VPPSSEPAAGAAAEPAGARAEATAVLPPGVDLHARPAAHFVRTALGFRSRIAVSAGDREADAKSLLSVLALGAKAGTTLRLLADGDDGSVAVEALGRCVAGLTE
jgi:phosphotransferase system HPr (HPr) family protein